jgi:hypothetical protein
MSPSDRSFVIKVFACVAAFIAVFIIIAVVTGFVYARMNGLPVDINQFYTFISPPFVMIITTIVNMFTFNKKPDEPGEPT